jgi:type IV pilus assembly protein PilW
VIVYPQFSTKAAACGFTLVELILVMTLTGLLITGLVQIASAASSSTLLQRNQAQIQENARLAINSISTAIRQTGFNPKPWDEEFPALGLSENSLDQLTASSDRLVVLSWSDTNCFNNLNAEPDDSGEPAFFIREFQFDLNSSNGLTQQCRYGPSPGALVTQIRRQGLVQGVESFQLLYGDDPDLDGSIEAWVNAGNWSAPQNVLGLRVGLLLASEDAVTNRSPVALTILDSVIRKRADGRLRRVVQFTSAIRGNSG